MILKERCLYIKPLSTQVADVYTLCEDHQQELLLDI